MTWWHYLTLVNIYLVLFYGFYAVMLKNGTFFQLNRLYLIATVFFSFLIPVMQAEWLKDLFITQQIQYSIYSGPVFISKFKPSQQSSISISEVLCTVYFAGIFCVLARFIWQLFSLKKTMATQQTSGAYSFFGNIKISDKHKNDQSINTHELAHAQQWHSFDVLLVEMLVVLNWFNPVVYLYRWAVKHLHEFIADRQVLRSGIDRSAYALMLVSHAFDAPVHQLVNPFFNKSLLKQRIIMLNKESSRKIMLIKYCLVAPLFILMLILSSATVYNSKSVHFIDKKAEQGFLTVVTGDRVDSVFYSGKSNSKRNFQEVTISGWDSSYKPKGKVYTSVEKNPEFPGGLDAFYEFLGKNIRYPAAMRKNNVQGKVIITFVVEKDGSLTGMKVVRGVDKEGDEESIRVLKLSPKWKPALQKGKPVRVQYTVPIAFTIEDEQKPSKNKTGKTNSKKSNALIVTYVDYNRFTDSTRNVSHLNAELSTDTNINHPPIYLLNGKEIADIRMINPESIESVSVLKDETAISVYGSKGAKGVIIIITQTTQAKS